MMRLALIIPTRNGEAELERLFSSLSGQTFRCDVFVVDSSSADGTVEVASSFGAQVAVIPVSEFNHGRTRQKMVEALPDYDVYAFMTQDACLADAQALERLIAPFADAAVGAVYGRQLPHENANPLAAHARLFNYPAESRVKSIEDAPTLGIKTPFISNSFAAYRREPLIAVGGFPSNVVLSEDMYVAARMILEGWKIAYASNACCYHSHNYTLLQEFRRYFDHGVFHVREPWIREAFGGVGGEGLNFVRSELSFLGWRRIHLWPGALFRNILKLTGFKFGMNEKYIPLVIKRNMSMNKRFWRSGKNP